jgi:hypothetical protein
LKKKADKLYMHQIEHKQIEQLLFELYNIFEGNRALMLQMTDLENERESGEEVVEFGEGYPELFFDRDRINAQISGKLLYLALLVRTIDDQYREIYGERYESFLKTIDSYCGSGFGSVAGKTIDLRGACNKIIHALQIIPLYEDKWDVREGFYYLRGTIVLSGQYHGKEWSVDFYFHAFLQAIAELLDFESSNRWAIRLSDIRKSIKNIFNRIN